MKKKILIDVDDVICDSGFLPMLNNYLGTNYKINDFTSYYIEEDVMPKEQLPIFYEYIKDKNWYEYAKIIDGAYDALKKINEKYDVYICSSCAIDIPGLKEASGSYFNNKYNFLIKNFPFLDIKKFIFTGVKNIMMADIQIDDRLDHLQNQVPTKLLFTTYHNRNIKNETLAKYGVKRVNNWKEIEDILL